RFLFRQFVNETRLYSYRVQVRAPSSSCFESFVEEFFWKSSTHRQEQFSHVPMTSALPEFFEASRGDQNRENFCLRIGVNEGPQTLMAFVHIRFDINHVLSVGQHSEVCRFHTMPDMTDMVNLVPLWDGAMDHFIDGVTADTIFPLATDPGVSIFIQTPHI